MTNIADFLFEVGILNKTPRSGLHFLGSGKASVSEHIMRTIYVGYTLAQMEKNVNMGQVVLMCLFHDLAEARTSDLNYVHQKYAVVNEKQAIKDLTNTLPFGQEILNVVKEYNKRKSHESILAKDADNLEWLLSLKEQADIGNSRAEDWIESVVKRLKSKSAKALAKTIIKTDSDHWWFADKKNEWWVSRGKN